MKKLGAEIRQARTARGMKQAEAAATAGLVQSTVSKIESGANASVSALARLVVAVAEDDQAAARMFAGLVKRERRAARLRARSYRINRELYLANPLTPKEADDDGRT